MAGDSLGLPEVLAAIIVAFGGPTPYSWGLGELLHDLELAIGQYSSAPIVVNMAGNGVIFDDETDNTDTIAALFETYGAAVYWFQSGLPAAKTRTITPPTGSVLTGGGTIDIIDDGTEHSNYINVVNDNVTIQNLNILSSNATGRTAVYGLISCFSANGVFLRDLILGKSPSIGVFSDQTNNIEISGVFISGTYADGIHLSRGTTNFRISRCFITDTGDDCISINSQLTDTGPVYPACSQGTISGCITGPQAPGSPGSGIAMYGPNNLAVDHCVVVSPASVGIQINAVESGALATHYPYQITVDACHVLDCAAAWNAGDGIDISDAREITISNTHVQFCARFGVFVSRTAKELTFDNLTVRATNAEGVYFAQNTTDPALPALLLTELYTDFGDLDETTPPIQSVNFYDCTIRSTCLDITGSNFAAVSLQGETGNFSFGFSFNKNIIDPMKAQTQNCIRVYQVNQITINDNELIGDTAGAVFLSNSADSIVSRNNVVNGYGGIVCASAVTGLICTDNQFPNCSAVGIYEPGSVENANNYFAGNNVTGSATRVQNSYTTTSTDNGSLYSHNPGWNPFSVITTPAWPGFATEVANITQQDIMVYVDSNGADITDTYVGPVDIGQQLAYRLPAGQSTKLVGSGGPPTWKWVGI
jgi:hypothetical protein